MNFLFFSASCLAAMSIIPVSPITGFSFLSIVYSGSSVLNIEGQLQKSLFVFNC